jgi:probable rRNA maturation factor
MSELLVHAAAEDGIRPAAEPAEVERIVDFVLAAEGVARAELSVTLVSDATISEINESYLRHEGPTDVVAFPLPGPDERVVGDVYVGAEQARRQAAELGEDPRVETLRLAAHGTLHVLGFDHPEGDGREDSPMYRRQEQLLAAFLAGGR